MINKALISLFLVLFSVHVAKAATITVETLVDPDSQNPPNAKIVKCTLRDAIIAANTDQKSRACPGGNGADVIDFKPGLTGSIALVTMLPTITEELRISGPRDEANPISINGGQATRLMEIQATPFYVSSLTFTNGRAFLTATLAGTGGAISITTGSGTIEFFRVRFTQNIAEVSGGAIIARSNADIIFRECEFFGNEVYADALSGGGAIFMAPSGIASNAPTISIIRSTFEQNRALRPDKEQFVTEPDGGAILFKYFPLSAFNLEIESSTFWRNSAARHGGAIAVYDTNGIQSDTSSINITNSTFSGNTADFNGDNIGDGGALYVLTKFGIRNSAIAGNTASSNSQFPDINARINSSGSNFFGTSGFSSSSYKTTDIVGNVNAPLDPLLSALSENGGFTKTALPQFGTGLPASPLLDQGNCSGTDQRGVRRPFDIATISQSQGSNACDIGAAEFGG